MLGWGGEVGVRVRTWGFRLATLFPSRLQWAPPPGVWPIQRKGRLTRPALHTHVLASSFRLTFPVNDIFGLPPALRRTACPPRLLHVQASVHGMSFCTSEIKAG